MANTIEKDIFLFTLAYQTIYTIERHALEMTLMPFDCKYGFDMLEQKETCPFRWLLVIKENS